MNASQKPKGPWVHRLAIRAFTLIFGILIFWALGFLVEDIKSIQGPRYDEIERKHIDPALRERERSLTGRIAGIDRAIANKRDEMQIVSDSSRNLQATIGQLVELQKITIERSVPLPEGEWASLAESLAHFLQSQRQYQAHNEELFQLTEQRREMETERLEILEIMREQRGPAREEFGHLERRHKLRLAFLQLLVLLPLLGIGAFLIARKRESIYFPLILGFGGAALLKVALVVHEYFPSRYFRYVLVIGLLLAVAKLLIHFIRVAAFPKARWLTKQYREAYERFLCPVCEYPIRTGPRRFLYWTRRTVNKTVIPGESKDQTEEKPYSCPACGTALFEECASCGNMRHSLLPHCQHCNGLKPIGDP